MHDHHSSRSRRHLLSALLLAGVIIATALLLALARSQGWIDQGQVVRGFNIALGVALAAYGNALPKLMHETPPRSREEATLAQSVARITSWAMTVAFLAWAALWALAPADIAKPAGLAIVAASVVVMIGGTTWTCMRSRTPRRH